MRSPALFLTLAVCLACSPAGAAEPPQPGSPAMPDGGGQTLTVSAAVASALGFRPEIAAARADERRAASGEAAARAALRPTVDGTANATYHDKPVPVTPFHGFGAGTTFPDFETTLVQGGIRVGYTLWDGGRRGATIAGAGAEVEAAGAALDGTQQAIAARTVATYLRVLTLGGTLGATDARIEALDAEKGRVQQLLDVGRAAQVDLRRAEAALAAAQADRVRVTTTLDSAERDLARLVGTDVSRTRYARLAPIAADAPDPLPAREALYQQAESNPELVVADRRLAAAEAAVKVADGAHRPTVSAVSDLQELGSTAGSFESEWSAGVQVAVPIFHGGALAERAAQASASRDAVAERLRATRLDLHRRLDDTLAAYDRARSRRQALSEAEKHLAEVVRIEKLRLDTGVGIQTDYLDAEASLLDIRANLIEARHAVVAARVDVARLTGTLGLPWIERELAPAPPTH